LTCKSMVDKKSTNNVPFLPFITTFMKDFCLFMIMMFLDSHSCVLWTTYGFMKEDSTLVFVNSVGASLQVLYMLCFLYISKEKTPQLKFIGCVAIAGFVVYFYMAKMITEHNTRTSQLGKLCTVVTIMMQASPLATVAAVVKTKSTESMPFVFSFMITLVSFIWLCYGIAVQDLNIQVGGLYQKQKV
ncbi:hypothetical protein QZH41_008713, partial [Actinostola sp. cb2023]